MYITYAKWTCDQQWSVFVSQVNWPVTNTDLMSQRTMSDWLVPGTQDEEL